MSYIETPDGVRLRLSDRGSGPRAFVLVHGWKQSHRLWDRSIALLSQGNRVVAFDLRGMGESDKPNSRYDFAELAADLAFVIDELDLGDVTLVGWSMGCTVALQHMAGGGRGVERLVLVNGPIRLTRADDFEHAMARDTVEQYLRDMESSWPEHERAFQAASLRVPTDEHVDWLVSVALQTPLDVGLRLVREQLELDMRSVVRGLSVPVLAAYGRHDPYYPIALARWIEEHAPEGARVIFDHSAHCIPFEECERFCEVLERFARGRL